MKLDQEIQLRLISLDTRHLLTFLSSTFTGNDIFSHYQYGNNLKWC